MIAKTFIYKHNSFNNWLKENNEVEKLILKGVIPLEDLESFENSLFDSNICNIEFDGFKMEGFDEPDSFDCFLMDDVRYAGKRCSILEKMLINYRRTKSFAISNHCVYSEDFKTLIHVPENETFTQPEIVEIIGSCAFAYYDKLQSVSFNNSLKIIDSYAFASCERLTEIDIPDSVAMIGDGAFSYCSLEKVRLSKNLQIISEECFAYNDLESIEIPPSVKEIQSESFMCDRIDRIIIPEGVEKIDYCSFNYLEYIQLPSTLKEIAKDFYYEEDIDGPDDHLPFIYVHPDNPNFYSENGSLFFKESKELVLDARYTNEEDCKNGDCEHCSHTCPSTEEVIKCVSQWRIKAEQGDAESQYNLGIVLLTDKWMESNYKEGIEWIKKSADKNYLQAILSMADYYYGGKYFEKNEEKSFSLLLQVSDKKDPRGLNNLAYCYEKGVGTKKDLRKALEYYKAALNAGYFKASVDVKRIEELLDNK